MKKNENVFSEPTRQSIVAIVLIIYKYINVIIRQIWPFLLIFLVGGASGRSERFAIGLAVIGLASMVWAILSYFKFYFYLKDDELVIQQGILRKSNLNIPLDRIQSVNVNQNIVHQLLNVVQLEVDTAGTQGSEFKFDALSKEKAEQLRSILISKKKSDNSVEQLFEEGVEQELLTVKKPIFNLSVIDLVKVGLTQNHFRSVGFVLIVFIWLQSSFEDMGISTDDYMEGFFDFLVSASFAAVITITIMASIIAVLISLVRTVLVYFDAHLWREGNRLKLAHGLFNKKEVSAPYQKIQMIQWSNNPLQKLISIFDLRLKQASSATVSARKSLRVPGVSREHVDYLKESWLGIETLESLETHGISIHYFYRRVMFRMIFCVILFTIYYLVGQVNGWLILLILMVPYFIYTSWLAYKKRGFAINEYNLYITGGVIDDDYALLPLKKVQNIIIRQTPYQSRKKLADIDIHTASGKVTIPYIPLDLADQLSDYFLYKVESSSESWM